MRAFLLLITLFFAHTALAQDVGLQYKCDTGRIYKENKLHGWAGVHRLEINTKTGRIYIGGVLHIPHEDRPIRITATLTNSLLTDFAVVYNAVTENGEKIVIRFVDQTEIEIPGYKITTPCRAL